MISWACLGQTRPLSSGERAAAAAPRDLPSEGRPALVAACAQGDGRFRIEHLRDNKPHLLRKGRFSVFLAGFGLCLDKDYKTGDHGLSLRAQVDVSPHAQATLGARWRCTPTPNAKPRRSHPFRSRRSRPSASAAKSRSGRSASRSRCSKMTASGRRSARSGAGVKHLTRIGPGRLVCQVRINGKRPGHPDDDGR